MARIQAAGGKPADIEHKEPHHGPKHGPRHAHPDVPAGPQAACKAATDIGWSTASTPRKKPRHFEVLTPRDEGEWTELHIDFAGNLYKQKPADPAKWHIPG